jgi:hypothetical protein
MPRKQRTERVEGEGYAPETENRKGEKKRCKQQSG